MKKIFSMCLLSLLLLSFSSSVFAWSPRVEGKPDGFRPGSSRGYYIWHDQNGFHLVTTDRREHKFSGVIRTDGNFIDVRSQRTEQDDFFRVSRDREKLTFKFDTDGETDGLKFRVDGGRFVEFDLFVDGHRINPREIHIGDDGWSPKDSNFRLRR